MLKLFLSGVHIILFSRITCVAMFLLFLLSISAFLSARIHMKQPEPRDLKLLFDSDLTASVSVCCYDKTGGEITIEVDCVNLCDGRYLLTSNDGDAVVPFVLTLKSANGVLNKVLTPNIPVGPVKVNGEGCQNNTLTFNAVVERTDINLAKFPYSGRFQITARDSRNKKKQRFFYITLNAEDFIRVSGLQDLVLDEDNGWEGVNERVCVFSTTGRYNLTATSSYGGYLVNGINRIPYELSLKENGQWTSLVLSQPYTAISSSTSEICNDEKYIGVKVRVFKSDMGNAPSGNYSDVVTLTVEAI